MHVEIIEHGGPKYELTVALRDRVLRQPLGLQFTPEQLAAESTCLHFAGNVNDEIIACCVAVKQQHGWFKIRQVAVDFDFQRRGFGRQLMAFVHCHITSIGGKRVFCHSRDGAEQFYRNLGYRPIGEYFKEVSIQHIRMEKDLRSTKVNGNLD